MNLERIQTREASPVRYRGRKAALKSLQTHAVEVDDAGSVVAVLCKRIDLASIAASTATEPSATTRKPTCERCARQVIRAMLLDMGNTKRAIYGINVERLKPDTWVLDDGSLGGIDRTVRCILTDGT